MRTEGIRVAVLAIVAVVFALLAARPLTAPRPAAPQLSGSGPLLTGVQFSASPRGFLAFDTRTGAVWSYENDGTVCMYVGRITQLGKPLDKSYVPGTLPR